MTVDVAHKRFHEVMSCYRIDPLLWERCVEGFASALMEAIREKQR